MKGLAAASIASALLALAPAAAQDGAIGPCSPYRAADGDIPSEMPGCVRRGRAEPGSLDDEMRFRRAREGDAPAVDGGEDPPVHRRRVRAKRHAAP